MSAIIYLKWMADATHNLYEVKKTLISHAGKGCSELALKLKPHQTYFYLLMLHIKPNSFSASGVIFKT